MRIALPIALFAAWTVLASTRVAIADDSENIDAGSSLDDELISEAIALRKQGRDADALAMFERAYTLRPSPRALAQIGLAHQALGDWREAERALTGALQASDAWINRFRSPLERSLTAVRSHLAWLEVESNIVGAEVWVGGELAGRLPLEHPIRVVAGTATVRVVAPEHGEIVRTVQVEQNSQVHAVFTFLEQPAPKRPRGEEAHPFMAAPAKPVTSTARTAGWITLGGAAGLTLVGVGALITREVEARIYNGPQCGPLPSITCANNKDIGTTAETIAIVTFVGAGVAAGVSGGLLLWGSRSPGGGSAWNWACGPHGPGLACDGSF